MRSLGLIGITPCFAQTTTYSYDAQGRLTAVDDSVIGDITYDYDDAGNLIDRTLGTGGGSSNSSPTCPSPYVTIVFNVNYAPKAGQTYTALSMLIEDFSLYGHKITSPFPYRFSIIID